jgi:hypothetical protein
MCARLLSLAAVLALAPALARHAHGALEVGRPFPELLLPALDTGRPMSLAEFRGRKVLLLVFASW